MNTSEILDLLSVVQAYDGRTVGQSDAHAWRDAAERSRWTYAEAAEAVKAHYAEVVDWIMPAHVTQRIKANRTQPPRHRELPGDQPASNAHRQRCIEAFAENFQPGGLTSDQRRAAHGIECPYCGADAQRACWQTTNGEPISKRMGGGAHRARVRAAEVVS